MGGTSVLVRDGARHPDRLPELIGDLLRSWALTVPALCILAVGACALLLHDALPISALISIVVAEVVCATAVDSVARLHQSQGRIRQMGAISAGLILARLATFGLLMPLTPWTVDSWAYGYFASSALYLAGLVTTNRQLFLGTRPSTTTMGTLVRQIFPFAFYNLTYKAHGEINKPATAHWAGLHGAGIFSVAHRCTDLVAFPTLALIEAMVPRIYQASTPLKAAATLGLAPLGLALLGGALLINAASWLPLVLGSSYQNSVFVTQALAGLPALLVIRVVLGSVIAAFNLQHLFLVVHGIGLAALIVSLWILIPAFGIVGAVMAAYALEIFLIAGQLVPIYRHTRLVVAGASDPDNLLRS